jgi:pimeloyl-ACP methyl ester carboxylesterase
VILKRRYFLIIGCLSLVALSFLFYFLVQRDAFSISRPQEPKGPFPYAIEEVVFKNMTANITLSGTLTIPATGSKRYPAVILISGYGAQNRDAEWNGHKPFLVLADHLTRLGIAVLRYDDRGSGKSTGDYYSSTSQDFAGDVESAVNFLRSRSEIDTIGLIGHSDGAMIAPMVATRSSDVDFIIMLGAPGIIGSELMVSRLELMERKLGKTVEEIERSKNYMQKLVKTVVDANDVKNALERFVSETKDQIPNDQIPLGMTREEFTSRQVWMLSSPWFKFFFTYDPGPTLEKVNCPVLVLTGKNDIQAPSRINLPAVRQALSAGKNEDVTVKELKRLNHMFQESQTGMLEEYNSLDETFSPLALREISEWIIQRFVNKPNRSTH